MNIVYKLVWSPALNAMVVASEFAAAKGKGKTGVRRPVLQQVLFNGAVFSLALLGGMNVAHAGNTCESSQTWVVAPTAAGNAAIACGEGANGSGENAVALGYKALASGAGATAIGDNAKASGTSSTAIGDTATAAGVRSVALGSDAGAAGTDSIAIGTQAGANLSGAAAGSSILLGAKAGMSATRVSNSIGIGRSALSLSDGSNNTVIGDGAGVSMKGNGNTVLGAGSGMNVTGTTNIAIGNGAGNGITATDTVAIGTGATSKSVGGMALGMASVVEQSAEDAIAMGTGAAVDQSVNAMAFGADAGVSNAANGIAIGKNAKTSAANGTALGANAEASNVDGVAVGFRSQAKGFNSTALGNQVAVEGGESIAIQGNGGTDISGGAFLAVDAASTSSTAIGQRSQIIGSNNANAIGTRATVNKGLNGIAIGTDAAVSNASNAVAIGSSAAAAGTRGVAMGYMASAGATDTIAIGNYAGTPMASTTQGTLGVYIGSEAGRDVTIGGGNTGVGAAALKSNAGTMNTALGYGAGMNSTGDHNISIGSGSILQPASAGAGVIGSDNIALGTGAGSTVQGSNNLAMGKNAGKGVVASNTIAFGTGATASKADAIAIGSGAQANGVNSISIGKGNVVSGANSAAIGDPSTITGSGSYSLGNNNTINANNAFVIGSNVTVNAGLDDAVVLGNNSTVAAAVQTKNATIGGTTYDFAGDAPTSTVSVGSAGKERTITNVAAGRINADSTDAINGSQLNATNQAITNLAAGQTHYYSVNDNGVQGDNYNNDGATGLNSLAAGVNAAATGDSSAAMGRGAMASANSSMALGSLANASALWAVAVGDTAQATNEHASAFGAAANASGDSSTALGAFAAATADGSVALGQEAVANRAGMNGAAELFSNTAVASTMGAVSVGDVGKERQITNVAGGTQDTDAVNIRQLKALDAKVDAGATRYYSVNDGGVTTKPGNYNNDGAVGKDSLAAGVGANAAMVNGVAVGGKAEASQAQDTAVGYNAKASGGNALAAGAGTNASGMNSTAVGTSAESDGTNAAAVGASANASGDYALAAGSFAAADGDYSVALGYRATAADENSVALGSLAETQAAVGTADGQINGKTYTYAGQNPYGTVSVGAAGKERTITNVAAGRINAMSTDAINGSQLYATNQAIEDVAATANAGWNVTDAAGNTANIGPNGKVTFASTDTNLEVKQTGADDDGKVELTLAKNLDLGDTGSVKMGDTTVNSGGLTIVNGPSITAGGIDAGNKPITNVAPGTDPADAVNMSQLNQAAASAKTEVAAGTNIASVAKTTGTNGQDIYTVNAKGTTASAGSAAVTVTASTPDANNVTDYAVDLSQATKDSLASADTAMQSVVTQVDGVAVKTLTKTDNTANFVSGANIALSDDGNGGIKVATTPDVAFDQVTINGGGPVINVGGIDMGGKKITNVAPGVNGTDAVNKDQLDGVSNAANAGWNVTDAAGNTANIGPNGKVTFASTDTNLEVKQTGADDDGKVELTLAKNLDLGDTGSVKMGDTTVNSGGLTIVNGPSITAGGIDAGNKPITNVAPGVNGTDAVNKDQLDNVSNAANAGWNVTDAAGNTANIGPNGKVTFASTDTNLEVKQTGADDDGKVELTLAKNLDLGDTGSVKMGDTTVNSGGLTIVNGPSITAGGIDAGNKPITNVAPGVNDTDAVNVSQLKDAVKQSVQDAVVYDDSTHSSVTLNKGGPSTTLTNVADGDISQNSTDAVNGSQLHATNQAIENLDGRVENIDNRVTSIENGINNVANGTDGVFQVSQDRSQVKPKPTGSNSAAGGANALASGSNALAVGNDSVASADNSTALGNGAKATHANSVAVGSGSETTVGAQASYEAAYVGNSASMGEMNVGNRTITGVAPGSAGTDAVNVNQLNAGVNHAIQEANSYTDSRLGQMQNDMWTMERGYRGATASAMAMSGIPQAYLPGKSMLGVGVGGYQGEFGMAVGLSGITENGRYVYKAQASGNTSRDWGFSVGAGIQW